MKENPTFSKNDLDEQLKFASEDETEKIPKDTQKWKILIVDDEEEIHNVTKLALSDVSFKGLPVELLDAYSEKDTIQIIKNHPDISIILLDIVMEEDNSGLRLIQFIRNELKNSFVRIIIRTAQPGQAPERKVIVDYDINDYKEKTELSSQKLFSTIIASLRSYHTLMTLEQHRLSLEKLLETSNMHDIGKVGIFDHILNKPDKLDPSEFDIIKTHTTIGYEIFKNSTRKIFQTSSLIALEHHEKYDGTGYPRELKGEEIHIFGRIVSLADIFDAIGTDRIYKKAWELNDILDYLKKESGKTFDPKLIKIFFDNIDEILSIRNRFKDE